jgi:6-phospho-3-hexuloisomerase
MSVWSGGLAEIGAALDAVDGTAIDAACEAIAGARAVVLYGCGREGLMMRALAMRLHHLGLRVAMQGDMACPPVGPGDLLLASAGPGQLATVTALLGVAQAAGSGTLLLTAEPDRAPEGPLLVIPARTMAQAEGGTLPMGSLYEGAMFFLFEEMVERLRRRLGETPDTMRARHTNLE